MAIFRDVGGLCPRVRVEAGPGGPENNRLIGVFRIARTHVAFQLASSFA